MGLSILHRRIWLLLCRERKQSGRTVQRCCNSSLKKKVFDVDGRHMIYTALSLGCSFYTDYYKRVSSKTLQDLQLPNS